TDAAGVLENLRVVNVHCVIEVEAEHPTLRLDTPTGPVPAEEARPGEALSVVNARLCLQAASPAVDQDTGVLPVDGKTPAETPTASTAASPPGGLVRRDKRLVVVDGADQGQTFMLPESGTVTLGKDRKHADIILHDLYVAKAHCRLK